MGKTMVSTLPLYELQGSGVNDSDDDDEDDEDDKEDEIYDEDNFPDEDIVEMSPKGRFGRYNVVLGRGAYKIVYKGLDFETGREIAWNRIDMI